MLPIVNLYNTTKRTNTGLEKSGRLVAICDQKIFLATRSWAAVVNLATNFSTQGSSLATPVLRWVPCANKQYWRPEKNDRFPKTKFKILKTFLVIRVTLTWHTRSGGKSATPFQPSGQRRRSRGRRDPFSIPTCHKYPAWAPSWP